MSKRIAAANVKLKRAYDPAYGPGVSVRRTQLSISGTRASRPVPCCAIGLGMIPPAGRNFDDDKPMRFTDIGISSASYGRALKQAELRSSLRLMTKFITMRSSLEVFFWGEPKCETLALPRHS
jgi:hypothetical protein